MKAPSSLPDLYFAIPGDPELPTGGYEYDRQVIAGLRAIGWKVARISIPGDFPHPSSSDLNSVATSFGNLPQDAVVLVDGLLFGTLPPDLLDRFPVRWAALVHHPLAFETGLSEAARNRLHHGEMAALKRAEAIIATSQFTARLLQAEFGVPSNRLSVALPGTESGARARGTGDGTPIILSIGATVPRKGYPVLIDALALLGDRPWKCRIVGALDRDRDEVAAVKAAIARHGLGDRIDLCGAMETAELHHAYTKADIYVSSSWFEGYGMALAGAMAHGLPVIACAGGAVETAFPPGAVQLVEPGDPAALAFAMGELIADPARRAAAAEKSWQAAEALPSWTDTAAAIATVLARLAP